IARGTAGQGRTLATNLAVNAQPMRDGGILESAGAARAASAARLCRLRPGNTPNFVEPTPATQTFVLMSYIPCARFSASVPQHSIGIDLVAQHRKLFRRRLGSFPAIGPPPKRRPAVSIHP